MINYYTYNLKINHESKSNDTDKKDYETDSENESSDKIINNIIKEIADFNNDNAIMNAE